MQDTAFFIEQIEDQKENWKADHESAIKHRDFEDLLRNGITLFFFIRGADESWSKKVQSGEAKYDPDRVRALQASYKWWISPCPQIMKKLAQQNAEFKEGVKNGELFKTCYEEAKKILSADIEQLIESSLQTQNGQTVER